MKLIHLLLTPKPEHDLSAILQSLKRYTAREINKRLGREGSLWQQESFNHIVRSGEQFADATNSARARWTCRSFILSYGPELPEKLIFSYWA